MKTTNQNIDFSKSVKASVDIKDLEKLGWDLNVEDGDEEIYHVDITVDDEGKTTWCLTNTEKADNGIWEGSDREETEDDEQTIKDLENLHSESKLFNIRTEYYGGLIMNYKEQNSDNPQPQQLNIAGVSGSVFRCGFCGTPTDKDGNPMSLDYCNSLTDEQLNSAELVHRYCCYEEQQDNFITVTRDMAIDAQDMSLEGQQWRW